MLAAVRFSLSEKIVFGFSEWNSSILLLSYLAVSLCIVPTIFILNKLSIILQIW